MLAHFPRGSNRKPGVAMMGALRFRLYTNNPQDLKI